jgi:hypothetical protein
MAITATVKECCDAIHTDLGQALVAAGALVRSQNAASDHVLNDGLTEGINDERVLQVYPEERPPVSVGSGTVKITLAGNRDKELIVFVDYYTRQRVHIGEDMALLVTGINAIEENLDAQACPYFEQSKIRSFQYSWQRVIFDYGGVSYVGARFRLTLRTY